MYGGTLFAAFKKMPVWDALSKVRLLPRAFAIVSTAGYQKTCRDLWHEDRHIRPKDNSGPPEQYELTLTEHTLNHWMALYVTLREKGSRSVVRAVLCLVRSGTEASTHLGEADRLDVHLG